MNNFSKKLAFSDLALIFSKLCVCSGRHCKSRSSSTSQQKWTDRYTAGDG